ncbi:MAG: PAS domain-containing protein [Bacteroidota bacterium]
MGIHNSIILDLVKNNPEQLIELLKAYQRAIDVNIISSITDETGTILYANDKFCEVSKYKRDELIGQNHRIINSGYHTKEFFKQMWEAIKSGNSWQDEIKNKAKDGTIYWVDTVIIPMSIPGGKTTFYLSLRTLITEKKIAEEERKDYTEKLREMLHMTSHRVRSPLARCLGLMALVEHDTVITEEELQYIVSHLKSSALELDVFIKELTLFMDDIEKKYNPSIVLTPPQE